jgi:hypothetical protein
MSCWFDTWNVHRAPSAVNLLMPIRPLVTSYATGLLASLRLLSASIAETAPNRQALHLLNRLAFGPTIDDLQHVEAIGVDRYLDEQLNPRAIIEPPELIQGWRHGTLDWLFTRRNNEFKAGASMSLSRAAA